MKPRHHDHAFGQEGVRRGERRVMIVVGITAIMMIVEIVAGLLFGSMALLADGLHMASHACALGIAAFAYVYARRHAHDARFSFGTGKLNPLAGFASAVLLSVFALIMVWESVGRLIHPVQVHFDHALVVAVLGLVVNGVCVPILGGGEDTHAHAHGHGHGHGHGHHDHNLRAAYLHVLADALTSLLAILALVGGKYLGAVWLDPAMGLVGAALVSRWSWGLMRTSGSVLLDRQAPEHVRQAIATALEQEGRAHIVDLHVWALGLSGYAAEIALVCDDPQTADRYKSLLPKELGLVHVTIEIHQGPVPAAVDGQ